MFRNPGVGQGLNRSIGAVDVRERANLHPEQGAAVRLGLHHANRLVGGGISPIIASHLAGLYGLKAALYFASCGLALGFIVSLFLKETAPRKTGGL